MVPDLTLAESHRLLILFTAYCSLVLFQWHDDMVSFFHSKSWFISKPSCWEIREILCRNQMEQKWHRIMHLWHFLDSPKILQVGSFLIALCAAANIICNLARSLPSKFQAPCAEYKHKDWRRQTKGNSGEVPVSQDKGKDYEKKKGSEEH